MTTKKLLGWTRVSVCRSRGLKAWTYIPHIPFPRGEVYRQTWLGRRRCQQQRQQILCSHGRGEKHAISISSAPRQPWESPRPQLQPQVEAGPTSKGRGKALAIPGSFQKKPGSVAASRQPARKEAAWLCLPCPSPPALPHPCHQPGLKSKASGWAPSSRVGRGACTPMCTVWGSGRVHACARQGNVHVQGG